MLDLQRQLEIAARNAVKNSMRPDGERLSAGLRVRIMRRMASQHGEEEISGSVAEEPRIKKKERVVTFAVEEKGDKRERGVTLAEARLLSVFDEVDEEELQEELEEDVID